MRRKLISICTPCYNEAENVEACYEAVREIFARELPDYDREHLFADNCSTDGTLEKLRALAARDPAVKVIANARNFGVVRSNFNCILASSGDAVLMFLPADLQDPPSLLPQFVKKWEEGVDVVYGQRLTREENWLMKKIRAGFYWLLKKLSQQTFPPNLSDFQLLDQKIIAAMRRFDDHYPFVRVMPFLCSSNIFGIPYHWQARRAGKSKQNLWALFDQGLNGIISTSTVLVRLAILGGVLLSLTSLGYALLNIIMAVLAPDPTIDRGITTLIAGMFLFNGLLLLLVGMIGEYVVATHNQVRRSPLVVERERINF